MALSIGQQIGPYEITVLLGKGEMGEVYRASDTKLKREVAIKILPEEFSRDVDRIGRFQREAEILASLETICLLALLPLIAEGEAGKADRAASPECRKLKPIGPVTSSAAFSWITPNVAADRVRLARWCEAVGAALFHVPESRRHRKAAGFWSSTGTCMLETAMLKLSFIA